MELKAMRKEKLDLIQAWKSVRCVNAINVTTVNAKSWVKMSYFDLTFTNYLHSLFYDLFLIQLKATIHTNVKSGPRILKGWEPLA